MPDGYYTRVRVNFNRLSELEDAFPREIGLLVGKAVLDTEAGMKADAPVLTGFLVNNIGSDGKRKAWSNAEYSAHVNYGTVYQPAQPFVEPTVERVTRSLVAALSQLENRL